MDNIKESYLKRHSTEYIKNLYNLSKGRKGKIKKRKIKVIPTSIEEEYLVIVQDHQNKIPLEFNPHELKSFLDTRNHIQGKRTNQGFGNCKKELLFCPNCKRDANVIKMTEHHIIPQQEGGKDIKENYMTICDDCHQQLHLFYTNDFLAKNLNTPEKILEDEKMISFSKFIIKKKKSQIKRKQSKNRKNRRH